jgi:hypothetical protein
MKAVKPALSAAKGRYGGNTVRRYGGKAVLMLEGSS